MRKYFKCIPVLLLLLSFVGCGKEITQKDFTDFSEKCRAQEYYQSCNEIVSGVDTAFYYNLNSDVLFETYTMLEKCRCDADAFENIKNKTEAEFEMHKIASDYAINDVSYDVFIVENENRQYGEFQEFGFIAFSEENHYIDFYWFYNQDYDMSIYDEASFEEFFEENFSWVKRN